MASEKRMRMRAKELVGSDLQAEAAPFSFPLPEGGEEIQAGAVNLTQWSSSRG